MQLPHAWKGTVTVIDYGQEIMGRTIAEVKERLLQDDGFRSVSPLTTRTTGRVIFVVRGGTQGVRRRYEPDPFRSSGGREGWRRNSEH